jgi:streptomycin 6-kinase
VNCNIVIPEYLEKICRGNSKLEAWLDHLPDTISRFTHAWSLNLGHPYVANATCSWVAPCVLSDGSPAVLKIGIPHMEAENEMDGLLLWNGNPTVFLLESDRESHTLLLERCLPGTALTCEPETTQDEIVSEILLRMWRITSGKEAFRHLSEMILNWNAECLDKIDCYPDPELAEEGALLREELAVNARDEVLLATDLHAGNILRSERLPWLAIDPKPFRGDPAYDTTQHLLNCPGRLVADPFGTISGFANRLDIDPERVRLWLFARAATECDGRYQTLARKVARAGNISIS